jgi:peptide/nickel transport system ATP-binding protein
METDMRTHEADPPLCEIDDLRIAFRTHDGTLNEAVRGLSLTLKKGERLGIVGESGSGKSLTGRALLGLLPPAAHCTAKALRFDGHDMLTMPNDKRRRFSARRWEWCCKTRSIRSTRS